MGTACGRSVEMASSAPVPMSQCKKDALIALERNLKKYLSLEELIDLLEKPAGGFMTEAEKMSVREQPKRKDKVEHIITLLRGKGDQDFDIFIKVLRESGNEVWAEQLEQKVQKLEKKSKSDEEEKKELYLCEVLLLGDYGVGKSNLISRLTRNEFNFDSLPTVAVDFDTRFIEVDSKRIKVHLWDTAGQERYRAITRSYYRKADAVMLVYDITRHDTFDRLDGWLMELISYATPDINIMLVGNKSDLPSPRAVSTDEAKAYAEKKSMLFYEASAKDGTNVESAFCDLVTDAYQSKNLIMAISHCQERNTSNLQLSVPQSPLPSPQGRKRCCKQT